MFAFFLESSWKHFELTSGVSSKGWKVWLPSQWLLFASAADKSPMQSRAKLDCHEEEEDPH